jgi:outer membrane immunogenic protein
MKKLLLASLAATALMAATSVHAADLGRRPTYKAPPAVAPIPMFSWTGCYIGAQLGGGWGHKDWADVSADGFFLGEHGVIHHDVSGFLGGGQIGCNYQFASNWVVGIEGEGLGAGIDGSVTDPFRAGEPLRVKTEWIAAVTGRLGWTWDRWMLYGKGGGAWAGDKFHVDLFGVPFDASATRSGWTVGAGLEWAFARNWTVFAEYDFYDFGNRDTVFQCREDSCLPHRLVRIGQEIHAVKVGVNLLWGLGKAPVVARY